MKIVVLNSINFEPPEMTKLPLDIAAEVHAADFAVAVYQDASGVSQATVVHSPHTPASVVIHDVI